MAVSCGALVVTTHGRTVPIQPLTDDHYYQALRVFGVKPSAAAAAAKGLITLNVKVSK